MGKGKDLINLALNVANHKGVLLDVYKIVTPFKGKEEEIDLMSVSKLEVLLDRKLLFIPTKQELRKMKLENINKKLLKNE